MTDRIRAELRRSGGFTGRSLHVVLDSTELPDERATELARLVRALDLTRLAADVPPTSGADLMRYDITIDDGSRHWHGIVADPHVPPALRPLLHFLSQPLL
ncbi:protealysin inhibitor emfourin [Actinoplanes sp. NPDC051851]|uniref:protealysin inhibitor emfourin n=1 Tax=Actinoplanes sp. NPDC051851 TaxID=3154753 RepID=UPI0034415797